MDCTEERNSMVESYTVKVHIHEDPMTRSSFSWEEDEIKDIQLIVAQEDGSITDIIHSNKADGLSFTGTLGKVYKVLAAANIGRKLEMNDLSDLSSLDLAVDCSDISAHGVPMFSDSIEEVTIGKDANEVTLHLTRMLARIDLILDKSKLESSNGFHIKSVLVYNALNSYHPFSESVRQIGSAVEDCSFDYASSSDISDLNSGRVISLYAFENMQGNILPENSDPWKKVPSSLYDKAGLCSYLEIECSYESDDDFSDDITYRMYLGKDTCTNFDVIRNSIYEITFIPTEEEIRGKRGSWKIESHGWQSKLPETVTVTQYRMLVSPGQVSLSNDETAELSAFIEYRTGTRKASETDSSIKNWSSWTRLHDVTDDPDTYWTSTSSETASVYRGTVTAGMRNGTARITATCYYDGQELSDYCNVNVTCVPSMLYLEMDPDNIETGEKSYGSVTVLYSDGTSRSVGNNECSWLVDRCGSVERGIFTADEPGTASITCTYQGLSASAQVNIKKKSDTVTGKIEITPTISYLSEGEETVLSAKLIIYVNGMESESMDITGSASWGIASGGAYVSCDGGGHYSWKDGAGESTVTASYSYDGETLTGEALIQTSEPIYLVSLAAEPDDIILDHRNYWSEQVHITASYSNGTTRNVTSECTFSDVSFARTANGWVTAIAEGAGALQCSYSFRGISKNVSIKVTSIEEWITEGIHCGTYEEGSSFVISGIAASKISPFSRDSKNVSLSKSEYSYFFGSGTSYAETSGGFII